MARVKTSGVAQNFMVKYFVFGQKDLAQIVLQHRLSVRERVRNVNFVVLN